MLRPRCPAQDVLANARRSARKEDSYSKGGFSFHAVWDHILESQCEHEGSEREPEKCTRCLFDTTLKLPEYPEMVFPHNRLTVSFTRHPGSSVSFNTLDALLGVCADSLPNVQVAPSAVWQQARRNLTENSKQSHPFDWTYSTDYAGTLHGCKATPSTDVVDLDRLRLQDAISFYSQVTLYEDELADHGCAQISVRIRVMPRFFFVLMRFYLRVDKVLVRVCDTRLVGDDDQEFMVREWSKREANMEDLRHLPPSVLLDANQVWSSLPVVQSSVHRIEPITHSDAS